MPSRYKKALRNSKVTNSFFNQVDTGTGPRRNERNKNHTTQPMEPDSSSDDSLPEINLDNKKTASVRAAWDEMMEDFTPENRHKWQSFLDVQVTIPNAKAVVQALGLAYKEMTDTSATADHFPPMDTFDLSNLEGAVKDYEFLCRSSQCEEECEIAGTARQISNLAVTASDMKCSPDDRLAAELDVHILNIHSKITVPLKSCLREAKLFNIDKRFGFVDESYEAVTNENRKQHGDDVPEELPLSFRQKMNNPSKLVESASEQSKKKDKEKLKLDDALVTFQRNVQLTTGELEKLKKTVSDAVKPIELTSPPSTLTYAGVPAPEGMPNQIRRRSFDAAFALNEAIVLEPEAYEQRRHVQATLWIWYKSGHEIWETGKRQIHEMPRFREYEYTRNALQATCRVAARQQVKIVEFYSGEGAPKLPQVLKHALRLGSLSFEEFDQRWETRCLALQGEFPSVDQMLIQIEELLDKLVEGRIELDGSISLS